MVWFLCKKKNQKIIENLKQVTIEIEVENLATRKIIRVLALLKYVRVLIQVGIRTGVTGTQESVKRAPLTNDKRRSDTLAVAKRHAPECLHYNQAREFMCICVVERIYIEIKGARSNRKSAKFEPVLGSSDKNIFCFNDFLLQHDFSLVIPIYFRTIQSNPIGQTRIII